MTVRLLTAALGAIAVSCGGAATETQIGETDLAAEISADQSEHPQPAVEPGSISRQQLDDLLAGGPAPLLAMVVTEPYRENGRFVGFRIVSFPGGQPAAVDLRPGDVILAVNGQRIERPEHYFEVFEMLKTAEQIAFDLRRNGADQTLIYPIVP